ncbi:probable ribosome production factor 1 [Chironomus tepperi]|uniref:probable ribosome production factor 1 n=1 Tax=Chironomus tepperi TaxID=113505 RepID=UPI00391F84F0
MSESSSEDFSDSDSDVSQQSKEVKEQETTNEKLPEKRKQKKTEEDSDDSDDSVDEKEEDEPQPVKKRKTLKDYLNEKAARLAAEEAERLAEEEAYDGPSYPAINTLNYIKNKEIRHKVFKKEQAQRKKEDKKARKIRKQMPGVRSKGHTIESLREADQTTVTNLDDSENEETKKEIELDEFSEYFSKAYEPKVLITYSDNPCSRTRGFAKELTQIIPNSLATTRHRSSVKKICASAEREEYTDILILNENRKKVNGLLLIHLPNGPTAHFKVSNVKLTKDLKRSLSDFTSHRPEVILTNFTTRLGTTIGRMLGAIFHYEPQFRGRRAVTFHNQRDYIFFRHHRYEFDKDGNRVRLLELGPKFTLKLRSLQQGLFDSKTGDYEWMITNKRHQMEENRRRFFL